MAFFWASELCTPRRNSVFALPFCISQNKLVEPIARRRMGEIQFITPEEAKNSMGLKLLYTAFILSSMVNILLAVILIKATVMNKFELHLLFT
jgi:hypothetical protein